MLLVVYTTRNLKNSKRLGQHKSTATSHKNSPSQGHRRPRAPGPLAPTIHPPTHLAHPARPPTIKSEARNLEAVRFRYHQSFNLEVGLPMNQSSINKSLLAYIGHERTGGTNIC